MAIQGTTEIPTSAIAGGQGGKTIVTCFTPPISFYVAESKIEVEIDRFAPRKIARGEIIQLNYTAKGQHGLILFLKNVAPMIFTLDGHSSEENFPMAHWYEPRYFIFRFHCQ
jgi:hypothetical protein